MRKYKLSGRLVWDLWVWGSCLLSETMLLTRNNHYCISTIRWYNSGYFAYIVNAVPKYINIQREAEPFIRIFVCLPKEIRDYQESIFFGLSARQFICFLLAVGVAVGLYFVFRPMWAPQETPPAITCTLRYGRMESEWMHSDFQIAGIFCYNILIYHQTLRRVICWGILFTAD